LREEGGLGFTLKREPEAVAKSGVDRDNRVDLAETTRVPFEGTITDPRTLDHLAVRATGEAADRIPDAPPRQRVQGDVIRITREDKLPAATAAPDDVDRWRAPSPFVESDDAGIVTRAKAIVGNATAPEEKVRRVLAWVTNNVEREPSLTIPSARDVLRTRRGDCNEHAVVAGIAYANDGFYYHAWNEVWLDRWVSVDAVFDQMPADATHVKLIDGGPEKHARIAEVVGRLALVRVEDRT
jgi:hypothetical protein